MLQKEYDTAFMVMTGKLAQSKQPQQAQQKRRRRK